MGKLTTHILDTAQGCPGVGISIELWQFSENSRQHIISTTTNADGRTDQPLLSGDQFQVGSYELIFHIGSYFQQQGMNLSEPPFLDRVPIRFNIADREQHYHVPLLASPWSYSTYRGN
jgi:5-hydroxyisourate hydrolase